MTDYAVRDFAIGEELDLVIANGDIAIADTPMSLANLVAFRIMTDPVEWTFDTGAVLGVQRFLGGTNTDELRNRIKKELLVTVFRGTPFRPGDIAVDVIKGIDLPNNAILIVEIKNINYTDQNDKKHFGVSVRSTFFLDTLTGKLTYIDDI